MTSKMWFTGVRPLWPDGPPVERYGKVESRVISPEEIAGFGVLPVPLRMTDNLWRETWVLGCPGDELADDIISSVFEECQWGRGKFSSTVLALVLGENATAERRISIATLGSWPGNNGVDVFRDAAAFTDCIERHSVRGRPFHAVFDANA